MKSSPHPASARTETVIRLLEQTLVGGDVDHTRSYLSGDFALRMALFPVLPSGPWAWTQAMKFFLAGLSEVRLDVGEAFGEGDLLALHFAVEARHTGPFGRIAATGAPVRVRALSLWRFRGTSIAEASIELSLWDALRQLGAADLVNSVPHAYS